MLTNKQFFIRVKKNFSIVPRLRTWLVCLNPVMVSAERSEVYRTTPISLKLRTRLRLRGLAHTALYMILLIISATTNNFLQALNPQIDGKLLTATLRRSTTSTEALHTNRRILPSSSIDSEKDATNASDHTESFAVPLRGLLGELAHTTPRTTPRERPTESRRASPISATELATLRQEMAGEIAAVHRVITTLSERISGYDDQISRLQQALQRPKTASRLSTIAEDTVAEQPDYAELADRYHRLDHSYQIMAGFNSFLATQVSNLLHRDPKQRAIAEDFDRRQADYERELGAVFAPRSAAGSGYLPVDKIWVGRRTHDHDESD